MKVILKKFYSQPAFGSQEQAFLFYWGGSTPSSPLVASVASFLKQESPLFIASK